jgi:hypothetical protein
VEDQGFGAIEVFRGVVTEDPSPKTDGAATSIANGELDPVAKTVVGAAAVVAFDEQAGFEQCRA